ncbi:MAG: cytochrome PufQ [Pseudomonadota bacterium]
MRHQLTPEADSGRRGHGPRWEYAFYFALIFCFSLPGAVLTWLFDLARAKPDWASKGIFHRARSQARIVTPMIFSA